MQRQCGRCRVAILLETAVLRFAGLVVEENPEITACKSKPLIFASLSFVCSCAKWTVHPNHCSIFSLWRAQHDGALREAVFVTTACGDRLAPRGGSVHSFDIHRLNRDAKLFTGRQAVVGSSARLCLHPRQRCAHVAHGDCGRDMGDSTDVQFRPSRRLCVAALGGRRRLSVGVHSTGPFLETPLESCRMAYLQSLVHQHLPDRVAVLDCGSLGCGTHGGTLGRTVAAHGCGRCGGFSCSSLCLDRICCRPTAVCFSDTKVRPEEGKKTIDRRLCQGILHQWTLFHSTQAELCCRASRMDLLLPVFNLHRPVELVHCWMHTFVSPVSRIGLAH